MDQITRTLESEANITVEVIEKTKDFSYGFQKISELINSAKKADNAIGIIINCMAKKWNPGEHEGMSFINATVMYTGLSPVTIRRHLRIAEFFEGERIPEHLKEPLKDVDRKSLIRIAHAFETHDISAEDANRIVESAYSGSEKSVSAVIRKVTGDAPRSNWLGISIDEKGTLTVHRSIDGEIIHKEIGRLHVNNKDETVQKGISRIINSSGIVDHVDY